MACFSSMANKTAKSIILSRFAKEFWDKITIFAYEIALSLKRVFWDNFGIRQNYLIPTYLRELG
jgi:hypothetical protein